jgi:hypothetical protein
MYNCETARTPNTGRAEFGSQIYFFDLNTTETKVELIADRQLQRDSRK